jgi:hypothetical protein
VIPKALAYILISTLLTLLIVTFHPSDALSLDTSFSGNGKVTISFSAGNDVGSFNPTTKLWLWVPVTAGAATRNLQWHATFSICHWMKGTTAVAAAAAS